MCVNVLGGVVCFVCVIISCVCVRLLFNVCAMCVVPCMMSYVFDVVLL